MGQGGIMNCLGKGGWEEVENKLEVFQGSLEGEGMFLWHGRMFDPWKEQSCARVTKKQ